MANFAKITCEYSDFAALSSNYRIRFIRLSDSANLGFNWTHVTTRFSLLQISQGVDATDQGIKAIAAVSADIANQSFVSSIMNVSTFTNGFQIEANEYGWAINLEVNAGGTNASFVLTSEVVPTKDFQLTGFSLAEAVVPCVDIQVTITEDDGVSPYTWITPSNASTTLVADIARGASNQLITVTLEDDEADQATLNNVAIPRLFTASEISSVSVVTNQGGLDATVTVFMGDLVTFPNVTYSIDGSNFQSSNVFPNVVDGDYTLYVNDGYGCIATQALTVDTSASVQRALPYGLVQKVNSLRYIQAVSKQYNTLENTLYRDETYLGENQPFYAQPYQTNDGIITTQFRSNYDQLSAKLLDCEGELVSTLTIDQKSDNIGSQDKRDCIAFNRGDNQTGLYFTTGNIYDPGTTDIIDTYELNGNLPDWGVAGNTVVMTGTITGSFVIKQVVFDSTIQANALVIDYIWISGNETEAVIAEVTYNKLAYETYEFDLDANITEGVYYTQILMEDSLDEYPDLIFNSEWIEIKATHLRTNFIEYSENPNTGIDYSTGYTGRVRIKSLDAYANLTPNNELTQFKDSLAETVTLKAVATMEGALFIQAVPRYLVEKINIIFTHFTILVNGEPWAATESQETQNFDHFSLKNITVNLIRKSYEEYGTDNVDLDGDKGTINQETGPLLQ